MEAAGFKAFEQTGITLNVNDTVRADATLQVGESKESVTVEANAVQVQSDTSEVSQTITGAEVADLATNGRNVSNWRPWWQAPRPIFRISIRRWLRRRVGPFSSTASGPTTTTGYQWW